MTLIFLLSTLALFSAPEEQRSNHNAPEHKWSIGAGFGYSEFEGETDAHYKGFGKRLTPWYHIHAARALSPLYGLRLQLGGVKMKGYISKNNNHPFFDEDGIHFNKPEMFDKLRIDSMWYKKDLFYFDLSATMYVSLINLIGGTQPNRKFDLMPYAGLSYARVFHHYSVPSGNFLSPTGGGIIQFQLPKKIILQGEIKATLVPVGFDGEMGESRYCGYWSFGVNVAVPIGRKRP